MTTKKTTRKVPVKNKKVDELSKDLGDIIKELENFTNKFYSYTVGDYDGILEVHFSKEKQIPEQLEHIKDWYSSGYIDAVEKRFQTIKKRFKKAYIAATIFGICFGIGLTLIVLSF